jgi:hypothetical protein
VFRIIERRRTGTAAMQLNFLSLRDAFSTAKLTDVDLVSKHYNRQLRDALRTNVAGRQKELKN